MRKILWLLIICALSPLFSKSNSWKIGPLQNKQQEAHHAHFSVRVNIEPPLSSYARVASSFKNLLILDIDSKRKWLHWKNTEVEGLKSWDIRVYVMKQKQWLIWKEVLHAHDIQLLGIFECDNATVFDCVLKGVSEEPKEQGNDELWRFWLYDQPAGMNHRLIAKGNFLVTLISPLQRMGGSARFLYTLDDKGVIQSFDTLRGYFKRELEISDASRLELEQLKDEPSQFRLKVQAGEKTLYLDPLLHSIAPAKQGD